MGVIANFLFLLFELGAAVLLAAGAAFTAWLGISDFTGGAGLLTWPYAIALIQVGLVLGVIALAVAGHAFHEFVSHHRLLLAERAVEHGPVVG